MGGYIENIEFGIKLNLPLRIDLEVSELNQSQQWRKKRMDRSGIWVKSESSWVSRIGRSGGHGECKYGKMDRLTVELHKRTRLASCEIPSHHNTTGMKIYRMSRLVRECVDLRLTTGAVPPPGWNLKIHTPMPSSATPVRIASHPWYHASPGCVEAVPSYYLNLGPRKFHRFCMASVWFVLLGLKESVLGCQRAGVSCLMDSGPTVHAIFRL